MPKKKTYVLLMSTRFMKDHPRAGDPTGFEQKILSGEKIHTIRANYDYWKPIIDKVNAGEGVLSVRKWSGEPYRSKQVEITQFEEAGIQRIETFTDGRVIIDGKGSFKFDPIAKNDGLIPNDFLDWFEPHKKDFEGALIHFTDFKY